MGATPKMNRSAKGGARSSLHYGGEGDLTFPNTKAMNEVFMRMKENMTPELRKRTDRMEEAGLFGHGKDYEKGRYTNDCMVAAWGEAITLTFTRIGPIPAATPADRATWFGMSIAK